MKEIYVVNDLFDKWTGISKDKANELVENGAVYGAEFIAETTNGGEVKITLLKKGFFYSVSEEDVNRLIENYFAYVESITGALVAPSKKES